MNWTCKGFTGATKLRQKLVRAKTPTLAIEILENQLFLDKVDGGFGGLWTRLLLSSTGALGGMGP